MADITITERHRQAVGAAIRELLHGRDFLALQLEAATGGITEEKFDELAQAYYREPRSLDDAREMAEALFEVGDIDVDGEELSALLGCTVCDATTIQSDCTVASSPVSPIPVPGRGEPSRPPASNPNHTLEEAWAHFAASEPEWYAWLVREKEEAASSERARILAQELERATLLRDCARSVAQRRTSERDRALAALHSELRSKALTGDWVDDVGAFQANEGITCPDVPGLPSDDLIEFRNALLFEEVDELLESLAADDVVGVADAIVDAIYILIGTARLMGLPLREIWAEVHRTNMTKFVHGAKFDQRGKVRKPDGWLPPRIEEVLMRHGWKSLHEQSTEV